MALGLSNTVGGFFQCFSVCPSMSRSLIQESTGGKTQARQMHLYKLYECMHLYIYCMFVHHIALFQIAGVVSVVIVLVTVLKLGSLFQELPKVCVNKPL